jgi:hypothetical protein
MNSHPGEGFFLSMSKACCALLAVALSAGCSGEEGDDAPAAQQPVGSNQAAVCTMDFEATVLPGGPSANAQIAGLLTLIETSPGRSAVGHLITPEGASLPVHAAMTATSIAIRVRLPDGNFIQGTGPFQGSLAQCQGQITGIGIGPRIGTKEDGSDSDRLHWLGNLQLGLTVSVEPSLLIPSVNETPLNSNDGSEGQTVAGCISKANSACIAKCGAQNSKGCGIEAAALCQANPSGIPTIACLKDTKDTVKE